MNDTKQQISDRIVKLFEVTLKTINRQSNCDHHFPDKFGSAYFRCEKCGFLAEDPQLDKLIKLYRIENSGLSKEQKENISKFI